MAPWNLSPNPLDHFLIHLNVVLQRVQRVLQLIHQLVGVIATSGCNAVADQVGDPADLVAASFHGNLSQVPPGGFELGFLVLLLLVSLTQCETAFHKARELGILKNTNQVEIEIAAVALRRLGMKRERAGEP